MKLDAVAAVVLAAGSGQRMAGQADKLLLPVRGKPVLAYCLEAFDRSGVVDRLVLVCASARRDVYRALVDSLALSLPVTLVAGGQHRQASVYNGLRVLEDTVHAVLIHDGARCCVTPDIIRRCVHGVRQYGACIAGMPSKDTIKLVDANSVIQQTPPREQVYLAQTPQGFRLADIRAAHETAVTQGFLGTDDAMLYERVGGQVTVVRGDYTNLKLTTPDDIPLVRNILESEAPVPSRWRIGQGYDVHRLTKNRLLILGGVTIPHPTGLLGHSDADVLSHAVMDALLGAAALGDIGAHFPATDIAYAGADSLVLLRRVGELLADAGYIICNIDATVCAQRPRLLPHIPAMRNNLAVALNLDVGCVGVKATTTEGLGFEGQEQGVSAQAVALVRGL